MTRKKGNVCRRQLQHTLRYATLQGRYHPHFTLASLARKVGGKRWIMGYLLP